MCVRVWPAYRAQMYSYPGPLSFRRVVGIPFDSCVSALDSWQRNAPRGELQVGRNLVSGPIEHDSAAGTCRMNVRLAIRRVGPTLRMRLDIDQYTCSPARTALELVPSQRVRPTRAYFRAGHLLLDSLTRTLNAPAAETPTPS